MAARSERRSFWTWGYVSDEPSDAARKQAAKTLSGRLGALVEPPPVPVIEDIEIREPRLAVPVAVADWVSTSAMERITHTHGGHALELLKGLRGQFDNPPDAVAHPRTEDELDATLAWCDQAGHVAIPYGGGTSVVWGVTVPVDAATAVTIDLDNLNTLLEVDEVSRAARVQGGMLGPDLEAALKPRGLTLRHFPQSFPWSTVGGWVATRSGGHYATNHTHIDDFVESTRMLTPRGWMESRRLPGSGAGPSPDRLVLGSEGILGIVSECWLRLQKRPTFRATAGVLFPSWRQGCEAVREIAQAKLWPANLRILDPGEAAYSAGLDGTQALLIVGFESSEFPQGDNAKAAVAIARTHGGVVGADDAAMGSRDRHCSFRVVALREFARLEADNQQRLRTIQTSRIGRLPRIENAQVGRPEFRLGNLADRLATLAPRREQDAGGGPERRAFLQAQPALGHNAENTLGAEHQAIRARPRATAGQSA